MCATRSLTSTTPPNNARRRSNVIWWLLSTHSLHLTSGCRPGRVIRHAVRWPGESGAACMVPELLDSRQLRDHGLFIARRSSTPEIPHTRQPPAARDRGPALARSSPELPVGENPETLRITARRARAAAAAREVYDRDEGAGPGTPRRRPWTLHQPVGVGL